MLDNYLVSLLIATPLSGALLSFLLPDRPTLLRNFTVGVLLLEAFWAILMIQAFQNGNPSLQLAQTLNWITLDLGSLGRVSIDYAVGIDGLNLALVALAVLVLLAGAISSWAIHTRSKTYFALYLVLSASIIGCFVAQDFFLFYLFFEFMLLPMYFLIGLWGGDRREYAALKFFVYTFAGSLLILIVMIGLYLSAIDPAETAALLGLVPDTASATPEIIRSVQQLLAENAIDPGKLVHTFRFGYLMDPGNYIPGSLLHTETVMQLGPLPVRTLAFWLLLIGFAVKLPVVPVHTWLPDAHVEAPTPVSVVLAGILLKVGGYGLIRIVDGFFPVEAFENSIPLAILAALSIVYGGFNALAQQDLKKMIAYSSVSHMGFVLLGIAAFTAEGFNGAIYQMVSHGVLSSMLFLLAGVLYERTHDRGIDHYKGLIRIMPKYTVMTGIAFFATLGLPGFSGFIGELFTLMGAFGAGQIPAWIPAVSTLGIVLAAMYCLWTYQRMFFGNLWYGGDEKLLTDLTSRETGLLVTLAVLTLLLGIFPNLVFNTTQETVGSLIGVLRQL
ncbi:NADH-quinone oxidoreductase subunit M [Ravibacter arvi]|uniref:NADH-quinone oxidoreductase subunit M n=1 Tax=Ravibacter arvi TaxID=2051041 RepID=A0ABP8MAZ6_9BACT